jgi:dTDP-4-dehydrorhamnose reductase
MPKIVVIGESGQLARSLRKLAWPNGWVLEFIGRRRLLTGFFSPGVHVAFDQLKPDLVLNAAAYTGVDRAEGERDAAAALNTDLPAALASACGERIPLVHVSTDYVFDGSKRTPYLETDMPNPLNVYGATKLAGDRKIESAGPRRWAILRTSWLVSEIGETFPVKVLRRARAGESLRVVDDQRGCPTAAADLARAMQEVGLRLLDGDQAACGLFNFCGATDMSWHSFAARLLDAAEAAGMERVPLQAVTSAELKSAARRPAYSILSCALIRDRCGIAHADIDSEIERVVRAIVARR